MLFAVSKNFYPLTTMPEEINNFWYIFIWQSS